VVEVPGQSYLMTHALGGIQGMGVHRAVIHSIGGPGHHLTHYAEAPFQYLHREGGQITDGVDVELPQVPLVAWPDAEQIPHGKGPKPVFDIIPPQNGEAIGLLQPGSHFSHQFVGPHTNTAQHIHLAADTIFQQEGGGSRTIVKAFAACYVHKGLVYGKGFHQGRKAVHDPDYSGGKMDVQVVLRGD